MQAMTFNEAVRDLSTLMDRVNEDHEPLILIRENRKPVVMISLEDFNAWQETEYLARSPANARDLLQAIEEIRARKHISHHDLIETL